MSPRPREPDKPGDGGWGGAVRRAPKDCGPEWRGSQLGAFQMGRCRMEECGWGANQLPSQEQAFPHMALMRRPLTRGATIERPQT
eukprot:12650974-Alexandrium_andersonii.AAC.2